MTESEDVVNAYPTIPSNENVLGEQVKSERIRPVGDVHFFNSLLFLSSLTKPIPLFNPYDGLIDINSFNVNTYKQ